MDESTKEIKKFLNGDKGNLLRKKDYNLLQVYLKNALTPEQYQTLLDLDIQVMEVELALEY